MLLHGSGSEEIEFVYEAEGARGKTRSVKRKHPFEGIMPNLERRYRETDSAAVREDLARYQSAKPCPDCHGTRLRREARHVFLVDAGAAARAQPIFAVEHVTLREASPTSRRCSCKGAKAEIADKVVREIRSRLKFLNDVGLNYLSLDRSADTLSGGEAQRIRLASQIGSGLTGVMYVLDEPQHRPAPARQRAPDRHAAPPARPRQQRARGRARRGGDPRRRPRDRHGPGRRRARRPVMAQGTPAQVAASAESLTGRYLAACAADRGARSATPRAADAGGVLRIVGARGNNLRA